MNADHFWEAIECQLRALRKAGSASEVLNILSAEQHPYGGGTSHVGSTPGFFAGSGGDGSVADALYAAGWTTVWFEAPYYWEMRAPDGSGIRYCEGDVCAVERRVMCTDCGLTGRQDTRGAFHGDRDVEPCPGGETDFHSWVPCRANLAAPDCPTARGHGAMVLRVGLTSEQEWCGTWFDCAAPGCMSSVLFASGELRNRLDEQSRAAAERGAA